MPRLRSLVPAAVAALAVLVPAAPAAAQDGDGWSGIPPFTMVKHYVNKACAMAAEDFRFLDRQLDYLPDRVAATGRHVVYAAEGTVYVTCRTANGVIIE